MTHDVTLAGYAVLAAALVAYQVLAMARRRLPTLGQFVSVVGASTPGRWALLLGWLWLGWHLFVRAHWGGP